ncbi:peroxiredoxin [Halosimplex amylolyticum]|uniref:peroxiredoxin n=1 Tax=Halosimplex amylolyticum TaxID=3396616 RepID=UPI003F569FCA
MALEPGDPAPQVRAPNQDGDPVEPDWTGVSVVYFYPKDDTPGCTTEAEQFQAELASYRDAGVTVYGVSTDGVDSHADFADEYDIEFDLLADPDGEVADAFDVDRSGGVASRTTFVVVGESIQAVYTGVDPDGHARNVLADLIETGVVTLDD